MWVYLSVGATMTLAYLFSPLLGGRSLIYGAIGLSAAVAIGIGVRRNRPEGALAWWMFAAAEVVAVVGDIIFFRVHGAFPSVADVFYLGSYPLLAAGIVLLVRRRTPGRDMASLLDSAIITIGLGVMAWVFLIEPYTGDKGLGLMEKSVSIGYPLMDILLLGVAVRLAMGGGWRPPAFYLLISSMGCLLVADVAYGVMEIAGSYGDAMYLDVGWLASYVLLGAAALHPSMVALTRRGTEPEQVVGTKRLAIIGSVLLVAPVVQAVRQVAERAEFPVVYVGSVALFLLVLARMTGLVRTLRSVLEQYRRAARVKDEFVSTVSHELRTPLTSIVGNVELLSDGEAGELSPPQLNMVRVIDRNSQRLLNMIENLLTLSHIDAKGRSLMPTPTDLEKLVDGVRAAMMPVAAARNLDLEFVVPPDMEFVTVDAAEVDRALLNLLSNACKFTPDGGRVVLRVEQSNRETIIAVSDTGIGIAEDDIPLLFSRFFRTSTASDLAIPGTGLGLSIVKGIVDEHHGAITVESVAGSGTTFTIRLPNQFDHAVSA